MKKFKLVQTITVHPEVDVNFSEILEDAKILKEKLNKQLKSEKIGKFFDVVVEIKNDRDSFYYKNKKNE